MAGYSRRHIEWILVHYWELRTGKLPAEHAIAFVPPRRHRSSVFETALAWISDVNSGIDLLNEQHPGRWLVIAKMMTKPNLQGVLSYLNLKQRAIAGYYLLGDEIEAGRAWRAVGELRKYLNGEDVRGVSTKL